ncbi:UNVERIFIED_CONTAM: hypothetical protein K2H54_051653 [Gekko kuhli]
MQDFYIVENFFLPSKGLILLCLLLHLCLAAALAPYLPKAMRIFHTTLLDPFLKAKHEACAVATQAAKALPGEEIETFHFPNMFRPADECL